MGLMSNRRHAGDPRATLAHAWLARTLLMAIALAALAWLAMGLHDARRLESARVAANRPDASRHTRDRALAGIRRAGLLDPAPADRLTAAGILQIELGRRDQARRTFERLVAIEPDTVGAWAIVADLSRRSHPERTRQAIAHVRALDPVNSRR
jgi:tetratricopeptide (TPR) repeat protein